MPVFKELIRLEAPQQKVWDFLIDANKLGSFIPGCEKVEAVDEKTFNTRIKVKVGPFSTTQEATMRLTEIDPPSHLVSEGQGNDPKMGSKVSVKTTLDLKPLGEHLTELDYVMEIKVSGRLAMLGEAVMRSKAKEISKKFAENLKSAVEQG